jgi:hypothetical protein
MDAVLNAVQKDELPEKVHTSGYSCFSKVAVPKPAISALSEIYKVKNIVSPPFPLVETEKTWALVEANGTTLQEADYKFHEAKVRLQRICQGGTQQW